MKQCAQLEDIIIMNTCINIYNTHPRVTFVYTIVNICNRHACTYVHAHVCAWVMVSRVYYYTCIKS